MKNPEQEIIQRTLWLFIKYILFIVIVFILSVGVNAQNNKREEVYDGYETTDYIETLKIYENLVNNGSNDSNLIHKLASVNYFNGNYNEAGKWYKLYYQIPEVTPTLIDNYRYGQVLKTQKEYQKADELLRTYYISKGLRYTPLEKSNEVSKTINNKDVFEINDYEKNTRLSEYPGFLEQGQLYVVGYGLDQNRQKKSSTSDIYKVNESGVHVPMGDKINSNVNEGPLCISADGNYMFFSRNDYLKDRVRHNANDEVTINIYYAEKRNDGWKNIKAFPFNSDDYSVGHPTFSKDNRTLYFASDKPGGKGGSDLYKVAYYGNNEFGEPINLEELNTPGDEMFPFIDAVNGNLYFSSNGPKSIGGLDVFISKLENGGVYKRAYSLGNTINSTYDDFSFVINKNKGYFASNREGNTGMDDIYAFVKTKDFEVPVYTMVQGQIVDVETELPLAGVSLTLYDSKGNILDTTQTNTKGEYNFSEFKDTEIGYIKASKLTFQSAELDVTRDMLNSKQAVDIQMRNVGVNFLNKIPVEGKLKDYTTGETLAGSRITALDHSNKIIGTAVTDKNGNYVIDNISSTDIAFVRVEKEHYLSDEVPVDITDIGNGKLNKDIRLQKSSVPIELGSDIASILNPIYFNYGKNDIRPDAQIELDKIVQVMQNFPRLKIRIESHTDSQGSDRLNLNLSKRRALSTYNYLIERGISKIRLSYKGYGESQLLNRCKNGVNCTDEEHEQNRRSSFRIINIQQ